MEGTESLITFYSDFFNYLNKRGLVESRKEFYLGVYKYLYFVYCLVIPIG